MTKQFLVTASLMGATTVIAGTIGALVLEGNITQPYLNQFNSGLLFQAFTTVALLAVTFMNRYVVRSYLNAMYYLFLLGVALYSIPSYLLSLKELTGSVFDSLSAAPLIGALLMLIGWLTLFAAGISYHHKKRSSEG
jgi:uncharacterized membrane protein YgdD (TMEM256/DUF423 family)